MGCARRCPRRSRWVRRSAVRGSSIRTVCCSRVSPSSTPGMPVGGDGRSRPATRCRSMLACRAGSVSPVAARHPRCRGASASTRWSVGSAARVGLRTRAHRARAARSWASANFSTLAAYRGIDGAAPRWIVAAPAGGRPDGLPSLEDLVPPLSFRVGLASARGAPVPVGSFRLTRRIPCEDGDQPSFDPVLNCPAGIRMWPSWLAGIRRIAYAGSRRGRGTDATRTCTPVEDAIT